MNNIKKFKDVIFLRCVDYVSLFFLITFTLIIINILTSIYGFLSVFDILVKIFSFLIIVTYIWYVKVNYIIFCEIIIENKKFTEIINKKITQSVEFKTVEGIGNEIDVKSYYKKFNRFLHMGIGGQHGHDIGLSQVLLGATFNWFPNYSEEDYKKLYSVPKIFGINNNNEIVEFIPRYLTNYKHFVKYIKQNYPGIKIHEMWNS